MMMLDDDSFDTGPRESTRTDPAFFTPLAGYLVVDKPLLFHASWGVVAPVFLTNVASEKNLLKSLGALQRKHVLNVRNICENR